MQIFFNFVISAGNNLKVKRLLLDDGSVFFVPLFHMILIINAAKIWHNSPHENYIFKINKKCLNLKKILESFKSAKY